MIVLLLPVLLTYITLWMRTPINIRYAENPGEFQMEDRVPAKFDEVHGYKSVEKRVIQVLSGTDKAPKFVPVSHGLVTLPSGLQCNITNEIRWFSRSHVLLINVVTNFNKTVLPEDRPPGQRWVAYTRESPHHVPVDFPGRPFNHTMTYSPHADIPMPYGECKPLDTPSTYNDGVNHAQGRRHLAAWFVSNCAGQSGRLIYVHKLQKYIPVHIYGKCGDRKYPKDEAAGVTYLKKNYKFYLAFENSLCRWYLTEKVFRAYESGTVPVVMGALNYSEFLPDGSYLHVADYSSPSSLARHMKVLDQNDTLYNEFFRWKSIYRCGFADVDIQTKRLCTFLHKTDTHENHIADFAKHFNKTEQCVRKWSYLRKIGI